MLKRKSYIIYTLIFSILPLLMIAIGVYDLIFKNFVLTTGFALGFFVFPLIYILISFFVFKSKSKTTVKTIICIFLVFIYILITLATLALSTFVEMKTYNKLDDIKNCNLFFESSNIQPTITELSNPTTIEYYDILKYFAIFYSDSDILVCKYADDEFANQIEKINNTYYFQTEQLSADDYSISAETTIGNYYFRFLSVENEEYGLSYPEQLFLIGVNEKQNEIVYISYVSMDLDYIVSIDDFINDDCGWKYVR